MTDGILLNELQRDRDLRRYDTIIIDEAHERSLNIDFILGYLKRLLPRRPDLKVVITSATIDPQRFADHFADRGPPGADHRSLRPDLSGRDSLPTARRRRRWRRRSDHRHLRGGRGVVDRGGSPRGGDHDILVFLSGEREIRDAADALAGMKLPATEIVPLVRAPVGGRAAPRLRAAPGPSDCPCDQYRRDVADRARHPVCRGHRHRADLALLPTAEGPAVADRADFQASPRASGPAGAAALPTASASVSMGRRTTTLGPPSPSRRSCGPRSPRSSCR
jgi:hypothetical protein